MSFIKTFNTYIYNEITNKLSGFLEKSKEQNLEIYLYFEDLLRFANRFTLPLNILVQAFKDISNNTPLQQNQDFKDFLNYIDRLSNAAIPFFNFIENTKDLPQERLTQFFRDRGGIGYSTDYRENEFIKNILLTSSGKPNMQLFEKMMWGNEDEFNLILNNFKELNQIEKDILALVNAELSHTTTPAKISVLHSLKKLIEDPSYCEKELGVKPSHYRAIIDYWLNAKTKKILDQTKATAYDQFGLMSHPNSSSKENEFLDKLNLFKKYMLNRNAIEPSISNKRI